MTLRDSSSYFLRASVICGALSLVNLASAQQYQIFSPMEFQTAEAPGAADVTDFPNYRFQHVYDIRGFQELPTDGPVWITHMDWRLDGDVTEPMEYPSEWLLTLSTTSKAPGDLSLIFAENLGGDETVVFNQAFVLDSDNGGPAGGPKNFDYGIELETPFLYDPRKGYLLADYTVRNGSGPLLLDFDNGDPQFTQQIFATTADATEAVVGWAGHITRLTVLVPEPAGMSGLVVALCFAMFLVRRRQNYSAESD